MSDDNTLKELSVKLIEKIPKESDTTNDKPTPAQYLALFAIAFTLFTNSFTMAYIYPFTGIMSYQFGKVNSATGGGAYAAIINMSFFIGRSLTVA